MSLMNDRKYTQEDEACLSTLLLAVGIMPSKAGFRYLKSSVLLYKEYNCNMNAICTAVAKANGVSKESVERDMRTAIENAAEGDGSKDLTKLSAWNSWKTAKNCEQRNSSPLS